MSTCARCGATFSCAMAAGEEAGAISAGLAVNVDAKLDANVGNQANIESASTSATTAARCWCTYLPAAVPVPSEPGGACWCPSCLAAHIAVAAGLRNGVK